MNRRLQQKNDHPGYSYERAPWALVTGVGPFQSLSTDKIGQRPQGVKRRFPAYSAGKESIRLANT